MVSRKQAIIIEMVEFSVCVWAQWIYALVGYDSEVIHRVFIYSVIMTAAAAICLIGIKNEMYSQIGFILCIMIATNLIGSEMGSLIFGLCIYMASGALISIIGNQKLNVLHIIISNISILYGLIKEYNTIVEVTTIEGYLVLIMFCEIFLITENYVGKLYQQKVDEIEKKNKLLNIAQDSKDEFLANMSHEIRTPMNVIIGMTELILREEETSEKIKEHCYHIQSSGENLIAIINDLLDFSKIESGKLDILYEPYSIASVVQDVVNTTMFRRGFKDIEIVIDCDPTIPKQLMGDVVRMRQILMNIAVNAVKYTEEGYVFISLYCYDKDGVNWLHMEVKDTGIGIKAEDQEHLFESFRRMDTIRNRSIEGTGLGLALCKRLTEAMNGEIKIESEYGSGTTVKVDIPQEIADYMPFLKVDNAENIRVVMYGDREQYRQKAHEYYQIANEHAWRGLNVSYRNILSFPELIKAVDNNEMTHIYVGAEEYTDQRTYFDSIARKIKVFVLDDPQYPVGMGENVYGVHKPAYSINLASSLNGEAFYNQYIDKAEIKITFKAPMVRALLVDDNEINLKVAEGILKLYEVNCVLAKSGKEAIEILKDEDIDIVFMDHMMPEMDGIEASKIIRRIGGEYGKQLPIIAVTANAVNDARNLFLSNGLQDFIAKPITIKHMDSVLRRWIPGTKIQVIDEQSRKQIPDFDEEVLSNEEVGEATAGEKKPDNQVEFASADGKKPEVKSRLAIADEKTTVKKTNDASVDRKVRTKKTRLVLADENVLLERAKNTGAGGKMPANKERFVITGEKGSAERMNKGITGEEVPDNKNKLAIPDEMISATRSTHTKDFVPMNINEELALENMGGQRALYKELMEYCLNSEEQRKQEIVESFEQQNWQEYTIRVHALKGSMRSLGIEELALVAQGQEFACKEDRIEDAIAGHPHLLEEYERGQRTIEAFLKDFQV